MAEEAGREDGKATNFLSSFIHTVRANLILRDFITEVYWTHYRAGVHLIHRQEGPNFIKAASAAGKFRNRWSDAMQGKMVRYLFAALSDFRLTRDLPKNQREILPFTILPTTTAYLGTSFIRRPQR